MGGLEKVKHDVRSFSRSVLSSFQTLASRGSMGVYHLPPVSCDPRSCGPVETLARPEVSSLHPLTLVAAHATMGTYEQKRANVAWESIQYVPHENCEEVARFLGDEYELGCSCDDDPSALWWQEGGRWIEPRSWLVKDHMHPVLVCTESVYETLFGSLAPGPTDACLFPLRGVPSWL